MNIDNITMTITELSQQQKKKIKNDKYNLTSRSKLVHRILYLKRKYSYIVPPENHDDFFITKNRSDTALLNQIEKIMMYIMRGKLNLYKIDDVVC